MAEDVVASEEPTAEEDEAREAAARAMSEEIAGIEQTAPDLPWEITLKNSATFYQRLPGGRMMLKFVPVALTPQGPVMATPGVEIIYSADGWKRFQEEVANDGVKAPDPPAIETARVLPAMAIPRKR